MKDDSSEIVSSEYADRRWAPGTSAVSTCREIELAGTTSMPAGSATATSATYDRCGAATQ
jgi:hypothetical protein